MITHVLIRMKNGDEELVPIQYLAVSKSKAYSGEQVIFTHTCENCANETRIPINAEQYDHLCCILKVEEI